VTGGSTADEVAVSVLSEDKKLADMNVGCLKVDAIFDRTSGLALDFDNCGS
jgi:hypothetical protein